ncbi:hypothetical protein [Rubidibacter lacunae]|uniref:hypothetical protein n=1 Tax=Rubidibacter lacunae TaxID=582514 RepID=UPI0012EC35AB|nr:hypothetical protein [Rubidibacter lacunae]
MTTGAVIGRVRAILRGGAGRWKGTGVLRWCRRPEAAANRIRRGGRTRAGRRGWGMVSGDLFS